MPCYRHARLPALHRGDFLTPPPCFFVGPERLNTHRYPGSNRRCPSSDKSQPLKAAPSSGADGDRASWDEGANLACRRRTLLRRPNASGGALSEQGEGTHTAEQEKRKWRTCVCKVLQHRAGAIDVGDAQRQRCARQQTAPI